jgi:hypothetical protein
MQATPPAETPGQNRSSRAAVERPVVEVIARDPVRSTTSDPLCASVYSLADSGSDAVAIAKQLDEHIGKVQLILALRGG